LIFQVQFVQLIFAMKIRMVNEDNEFTYSKKVSL
jgi:hypothetical protein